MIYDYENKEGYVSIWIGTCKDYDTLDKYLSTIYFDEESESTEFECSLDSNIFANQTRACEEELKSYFNYEVFNQFEYDFGLAFDEDFREAEVYDNDTDNLETLLEGFSYLETFIDEAKTLTNHPLPKCNAAVLLYNFKYCGDIRKIERENISLYFLGYAKYQALE